MDELTAIREELKRLQRLELDYQDKINALQDKRDKISDAKTALLTKKFWIENPGDRINIGDKLLITPEYIAWQVLSNLDYDLKVGDIVEVMRIGLNDTNPRLLCSWEDGGYQAWGFPLELARDMHKEWVKANVTET